VVYLDAAVAAAKYGGSVGLAIMATPDVVQVYAEKLYCGWLQSIMNGVNDPLGK
jgi:hypothetical protein